jgi:hypothetical protein
MSFLTKANPTPANIRLRVTRAQEAIDAAMDLTKKRSIAKGESFNECKRKLHPLDQAHAWLVEAQRRIK